MMTPAQAAYRAGCLFREVEARYAKGGHFSRAAFGNCSRLPARMPVFLRHVWPKALRDPAVVALLDGWECPDRPFSEVESATFFIGYYHQKTARELPDGFGPRLQSLREAAGLSVADFAEKCELSRQAVYDLEAGKYRPTFDVVQRIADALGVLIDTFRD